MGFCAEGGSAATVERVGLTAPDVVVDAIHAAPAEVPPSFGVVVHPDIGGVRPLFDEICRRLATHGAAVCAPEPFARVAAAEREGAEVESRMAWVSGLDDSNQVGDLARAADFLVDAHGPLPVGVIGFCMGGHYTYKAATAGRFGAAVSCYGMIRTPDDWQGPGHAEPLGMLADACPTLAIIGSADPYTPPDDVEALREVLTPERGHEIVVYQGAEHGFVHDPDRDAHRPDDAADVWSRALAWLHP